MTEIKTILLMTFTFGFAFGALIILFTLFSDIKGFVKSFNNLMQFGSLGLSHDCENEK